jgi:hypothetical protein
MGEEAQPFPPLMIGALVVEQKLAPLADPDGKIAQLGGPGRGHAGVLHQAALKAPAGAVDVYGDQIRHREFQVLDQDRRDTPDGPVVAAKVAGAVGPGKHGVIDRYRKHHSAAATTGNGGHYHEDEQAKVARTSSSVLRLKKY